MIFRERCYWVDPPGQAPPEMDPHYFLSYDKPDGRRGNIKLQAFNLDAAKTLAEEVWMRGLQGTNFKLTRKIFWGIGSTFSITVGEWVGEEGTCDQ